MGGSGGNVILGSLERADQGGSNGANFMAIRRVLI
jgi:hypothetical protein